VCLQGGYDTRDPVESVRRGIQRKQLARSELSGEEHRRNELTADGGQQLVQFDTALVDIVTHPPHDGFKDVFFTLYVQLVTAYPLNDL